MSDGYFMPKNVFKGKDSNGNSYRFEEWDFSTLATIEGAGFLITLIFILALASVISPIMLILLLAYVGGTNLIGYVITALISAYVLYDFAHGWLCLISTSFFLSDEKLGYVMMANVATLLISIVFIALGGAINKYIFQPIAYLTEDEYNKLKPEDKEKHHKAINRHKDYIVILVIIIASIGVAIGYSVQKQHKNWVQENIKIKED